MADLIGRFLDREKRQTERIKGMVEGVKVTLTLKGKINNIALICTMIEGNELDVMKK